MSFTFSDFHLPCLSNRRSFTPSFTANITPPNKDYENRNVLFLTRDRRVPLAKIL